MRTVRCFLDESEAFIKAIKKAAYGDKYELASTSKKLSRVDNEK
jgi:hypothetical protein